MWEESVSITIYQNRYFPFLKNSHKLRDYKRRFARPHGLASARTARTKQKTIRPFSPQQRVMPPSH